MFISFFPSSPLNFLSWIPFVFYFILTSTFLSPLYFFPSLFLLFLSLFSLFLQYLFSSFLMYFSVSFVPSYILFFSEVSLPVFDSSVVFFHPFFCSFPLLSFFLTFLLLFIALPPTSVFSVCSIPHPFLLLLHKESAPGAGDSLFAETTAVSQCWCYTFC